MNDYFKKAKDLQKAEEALKSSIERIASECDIAMDVKFHPEVPLVKVAGTVETINIDEDGIIEPSFGNQPTSEDWSILLTKLKNELKNPKDTK